MKEDLATLSKFSAPLNTCVKDFAGEQLLKLHFPKFYLEGIVLHLHLVFRAELLNLESSLTYPISPAMSIT